jgi:hypothetical protein
MGEDPLLAPILLFKLCFGDVSTTIELYPSFEKPDETLRGR